MSFVNSNLYASSLFLLFFSVFVPLLHSLSPRLFLHLLSVLREAGITTGVEEQQFLPPDIAALRCRQRRRKPSVRSTWWMRMETLENWEAEWSVGEPTSCCFVDHETTSSSSLAEYGSGRVRAAASASLCELLPHCHWRAISVADQQPTCRKRKRDPDPVAQHLIGSGSENPSTSDIKVTTNNNNNRTISFKQQEEEDEDGGEADAEAIQQMKEMIYRAAAFRPVNLGVEAAAEKPRRKNVRISTDPQTVSARQRRERISDRLRHLQKLVPGGSKMDTASMLDEAANYLKFLRSQVNALQAMPLPLPTTNGYYFSHLLLQHQHYTKTKSS